MSQLRRCRSLRASFASQHPELCALADASHRRLNVTPTSSETAISVTSNCSGQRPERDLASSSSFRGSLRKSAKRKEAVNSPDAGTPIFSTDSLQ